MSKKVFRLKFIISVLFLNSSNLLNAQNVRDDINKASVLMGEGKYNEAYCILQKSSDKQAEEISDTCLAYFNYYKGSCLYYLKKYEEAIPCLKKSIQAMDKLHYKNCDYLEMLYGMGTCYKELKDYTKAEEYLRRTIIRGTYMGLNCAIRETTYDELADLYVIIGKPEFADYCSVRKAQETVLDFLGDEEKQINVLYEAAEAYAEHGNEEECIKTYKEILDLIKTKKGKVNDDYLLYARLLSSKYNYEFNKPFEASEINKEIIEIGKEFKTNKEIVAYSYEDYLTFLANQGKKDSVELFLPEAVKYCEATNFNSDFERNLYEDIGLGLYNAHEFDEGVKYLEKEWKGKTANSILALNILGDYYFNSNPEKAISYLKTAEDKINNGLQVNDNVKQIICEYLMYLNEKVGNFQESIKYAELLEPLIKNKNDNNYYIRHIMSWAADCAHADNKEKALALVKKVEPLIDQADDKTKINTYSNMGFVYLLSEKYDDAISIINKGIEFSLEKEGEKCPALATLYHNLGRSYMLKKEYQQALSALNKSRDLQLELEGEVMQRTSDYINECIGK